MTGGARGGRVAVADLPDGLSGALLGLGDLLLEEDDLDDALTTVLQVGLRTFGDEPEISLTVSHPTRPRDAWSTREATCRWAHALDAWQYEHGEGPCLEADRTRQVCVVQDVRDDERFPAFGHRAAELGVLSCVSYPMPVRGTSLGSINAFYAEPHRVTDEVRARGMELATAAAPLLANWLAHRRVLELTDQLEEALEGRAVIERAKGLLMGKLGIGDDEAFELLSTQSQHENTKLRVVAARLLEQRRHG